MMRRSFMQVDRNGLPLQVGDYVRMVDFSDLGWVDGALTEKLAQPQRMTATLAYSTIQVACSRAYWSSKRFERVERGLSALVQRYRAS